MTKSIEILKFRVRRDGVYFGPGQPRGKFIYDLPKKEADKLIAESNGTIIELPKRQQEQVFRADEKLTVASDQVVESAPEVNEPKPIESMKLDELKKYAAGLGIEIKNNATKNDYIEAINLAQQQPLFLTEVDPAATVVK